MVYDWAQGKDRFEMSRLIFSKNVGTFRSHPLHGNPTFLLGSQLAAIFR